MSGQKLTSPEMVDKPKGRPVGGTEHSCRKAVGGGSGIAVLAVITSKFPGISILENAVKNYKTPIQSSGQGSNIPSPTQTAVAAVHFPSLYLPPLTLKSNVWTSPQLSNSLKTHCAKRTNLSRLSI